MNSSERARTNHRILITLLGVLLIIAAPFFVARWWGSRSSVDAFVRVMNVGKNYYDKGETARAIQAFQQAIALNPTHPDARLNLANAYLMAGESEKAISQAQEALHLDHDSAAAHYLLGCGELRLRQFQPALQELQTAYNIDPNIAAVDFQLGRAHQELGQWADAISAFQETLLIDPNHPSAHYALSQAFLRVGRRAEANQELDKHHLVSSAMASQGNDPAIYERCDYTQARVPIQIEKPSRNGIPVTFSDVSSLAFGALGTELIGPAGVIDLDHDGRNSLFVLQAGKGFAQ